MKKILSVVVLSLFLVGCGEPKLDGSSMDSLKFSIEQVKNKLNADQNDEFDRAMMKLTAFYLFDTAGNQEQFFQKLTQKLDGKTATEVILMANQLTYPNQ